MLCLFLLTLFHLCTAPEIDIEFNPEINREVTDTRLYRLIGGQWVESAMDAATTSRVTSAGKVATGGQPSPSSTTSCANSNKSKKGTKRATTSKSGSASPQTLSLNAALNPGEFLESLVATADKGKTGTYHISESVAAKQKPATGSSAPATAQDEHTPLMYRNVVCLDGVVTTTVCCTGPESSREYLIMFTPRQIPCDTRNCVETCQLVKSIPGYEGFSLKSDEDYFDAVKLVKRRFVEASTQGRNGNSSPVVASSRYFTSENDLNVVDIPGDSEPATKTLKRDSSDVETVPGEIIQFLDLCKLLLGLKRRETAVTREESTLGRGFGGIEVSGLETSTAIVKAKSVKCRWGPGGGGPKFSPKPITSTNESTPISTLNSQSAHPPINPCVVSTQAPSSNRTTTVAHSCTLNSKQWAFLIDFINSHLSTEDTDCDGQVSTCRPNFENEIIQTRSQANVDSSTTVKSEFIVSSTTVKHKTKRPTTSKSRKQKQELPRPFTSNSSVEQYLNYLNEVTSKVTRQMKLAAWQYETNVNHETRKKSMVTSVETAQFQKRLNNELIKLQLAVSDPKYLRQVKLLYVTGVSALPDVKIIEFDQVHNDIQSIYQSAKVSRWKSQSEKVSLTPFIERVMAKSDTPEEMLYYWIEWRKATGRRVRSLFEHYVDLLNQSAYLNAFADVGEMWSAPYETEDFMQILASEMEEVIPLYKQLHAYVRHSLHLRYGKAAGAYDTGPIPAHLTGDLFGQNWKHLYRFVAPYSTATNLSNIDLEGHNYTVERMARDAERMFHSLGFENLPNLFWTRSKFNRVNETNEDCTSTAWNMETDDDFRIQFCGGSTMDDFATIHKLVAQVEYFTSFRKQPFPFQAPANPGFIDAVGGAILLSAKTRRHLETLGLETEDLNNDEHTRLEEDINFLMKMALERVASLPYVYVLDLWRSKVFQGEITRDEYTRTWWQLRERYQGVASPVHRTEEDFDVGANSRVVASEPFIKDFVSNIMEFQFHESLCAKAGHAGPLHACDISSSPTAGYYLRNVMSLGASEHWRVAMKKLTGQRKVSARPLLRYFQPLSEWLQTKNRAERHHIGWERI